MSKEIILKQIEETLKFIELLRDVLLDDNCTIILDGHTEWQFYKKYHMKDITFEYRHSMAKSLQEIIKELALNYSILTNIKEELK